MLLNGVDQVKNMDIDSTLRYSVEMSEDEIILTVALSCQPNIMLK